jgi:hypothetical protein
MHFGPQYSQETTLILIYKNIVVQLDKRVAYLNEELCSNS